MPKPCQHTHTVDAEEWVPTGYEDAGGWPRSYVRGWRLTTRCQKCACILAERARDGGDGQAGEVEG